MPCHLVFILVMMVVVVLMIVVVFKMVIGAILLLVRGHIIVVDIDGALLTMLRFELNGVREE